MTELLSYRSQQNRQDSTAVLGVVICLAGWTMFFAAALFGAAFTRLSASQLAPAVRLPGGGSASGLPALSALVLVATAAAMQVGVARVTRGRPLELSAALIVALLFGLLFLGLDVVLWLRLARAGLRFGSGDLSSVIVLTSLHALHVAVGVVAIAALLVRSTDDRYTAARHLAVRLWTLYWHFVAAMGLGILAVLTWT